MRKRSLKVINVISKGSEQERIKVRVLRSDPSNAVKPHFDEYEVPIVRGMSVTNVLSYIYENLDSSLAYYGNCHRGVCGRCVITINGKRSKACTKLSSGDLTLEPIAKRKVIRDLIVEGI